MTSGGGRSTRRSNPEGGAGHEAARSGRALFIAPPGLEPQALRQTSREDTILLYAPALDPHLQKLTELADRVFCIYSEQAPAKGRKAEAKMPPGAQRTLEAYS
jgi:hypothetical protein